MRADQPDLFHGPEFQGPEAQSREAEGYDILRDPLYLDMIRRSIYPLLEQAEAAERLPWDATRTAVVELSIESQRLRLPPEECEEVGRRLVAALDRLWALETPRAP